MRTRKTQLVCQHIENISRTALEKHQEIIRQYVRGRHGVYALYRRGKLYYVGLATNLRNRLRHHLKDRHGASWDRFSVYLTIGDSHLRELEALILRTVRPTGNKQKGKFARSEDLRRRFRQAVKRSVLADVDDMFGERRPARKRREKPVKTKGRKAVLAEYISRPFVLRAKHKGKTVTARVRRDGTIRFKGKLYTSPSLVAAAACGRKTRNGWSFWTYERAPGDWVLLDELRKR
jgi:hypothetical protein